jgi:hypothetical protein
MRRTHDPRSLAPEAVGLPRSRYRRRISGAVLASFSAFDFSFSARLSPFLRGSAVNSFFPLAPLRGRSD